MVCIEQSRESEEIRRYISCKMITTRINILEAGTK